MALSLGAIFTPELDAQCRDFVRSHCRERITPGPEDVRHHRGEVFVAQVSHAGHDGVVFLVVHGDRSRKTEQGDAEHLLPVALQVVGAGQRRKRTGQSAPVGLVTGSAVGLVDFLAVRHDFVHVPGRGLGRVDRRGGVPLVVGL